MLNLKANHSNINPISELQLNSNRREVIADKEAEVWIFPKVLKSIRQIRPLAQIKLIKL